MRSLDHHNQPIHNAKVKLMDAKFRLAFVATLEANNAYKVIVEIDSDVTGRRSYLKFDPSELDRPDLVVSRLKNHGVDMPRDKEAAKAIVDKLIGEPAKLAKPKLVVDSSGWHSSGVFITPERTYGSAKPFPIHSSRLEVPRTKARARANIELWKEGLASLTKHSYSAIFAVSYAFCGPLLSKGVELTDVPVVNFWADTSVGKTTLLSVANTCFESPKTAKKLYTFNHSERAREESLNARNGLFLPVDERNLTGDLRKFIFDVASGKGKSRSKAVHETLPDVDWMCAVLISSNSPAVGGGEANSPEGVRIIDLRIRKNEVGGIFEHGASDFSTKKRARIIQKCIAKCRLHSGSAGRELLRALTNEHDQEENFALARQLWNEFILDNSPGLTSPQQRVLEKFALIYASSVLAARLNIVPWSEAEGKEAIVWSYKRYIAQNKVSYINNLKLHRDIQALTADSDLFLPLGIDRIQAARARNAIGFNAVFDRRPVACVFDSKLDALSKKLGCGAGILRSLIFKSEVLVRDASGKLSVMMRDPLTKSRRRFVALDLKRLRKMIE